jgi:pyruvate kinase
MNENITHARAAHARLYAIVRDREAGQAVHAPGKAAPFPVPTSKDLDDVRFGVKHEVDWIAQSYATSPDEIERLRYYIRQQDSKYTHNRQN